MPPLRLLGIGLLVAAAVLFEANTIARYRQAVRTFDAAGRPQELLRAQARLELGLRLATAQAISSKYIQRFQYPWRIRRLLEPLVHSGADATLRDYQRYLAREYALNEFSYLTLNILPPCRTRPRAGLPSVLGKAHAECRLALNSAELDLKKALAGGPDQSIYRNRTRLGELFGGPTPSYVTKGRLAQSWAVQKLRETTTSCLAPAVRRRHNLGWQPGPKDPPPGLMEHFLALQFGLDRARNALLTEVRRFVESLDEGELVFAAQYLKNGMIKTQASQLEALEVIAAIQEFALLRHRSIRFPSSDRSRATPDLPPVLQAELSRAQCEMALAEMRTQLEVAFHLQEDPAVAEIKARSLTNGLNPLFAKKMELGLLQAWIGLDETFLDVLPEGKRDVDLLPLDLTNGPADRAPPSLRIAYAKLDAAIRQAEVAQSSTIRGIQLGKMDFSREARQAMDGVGQWVDLLEKMKRMAPIAANENQLSREVAVVDFQTTTRTTLPRPEP